MSDLQRVLADGLRTCEGANLGSPIDREEIATSLVALLSKRFKQDQERIATLESQYAHKAMQLDAAQKKLAALDGHVAAPKTGAWQVKAVDGLANCGCELLADGTVTLCAIHLAKMDGEHKPEPAPPLPSFTVEDVRILFDLASDGMSDNDLAGTLNEMLATKQREWFNAMTGAPKNAKPDFDAGIF